MWLVHIRAETKAFSSKISCGLFFDEPCRPAFLRNWHNHFDNSGNYISGYCGGISLGNIRKLDTLIKERIRAEEYPVLGCLINENVKALLKLAGDFGYRTSGEGYFSKCHLCTDIRKFLVLKKEFKELRPVEFYSHLE